ncbi:MAG TPA: response regulator [Clostridiales bacterium]|nr:response regulator [Clostridiales bacterium]
MIKIMIVDDEVWIRTSIKNKIPWDENLVLCAEVSDGFEAIQMAEVFHPHIIITDVRMPALNGIEMMKKLKEEMPYVESIFVSGYSEFSYVKEAIDLNSSGYILKPIKKEELLGVLDKAINKIHQNSALGQVSKTSYEILNSSLKKIYDEAPIDFQKIYDLLNKLGFYTKYKVIFLLRVMEEKYDYTYVYQNLVKMVSDISRNLTFTVFPVSNNLFGIFISSNSEFDTRQYARMLRNQVKNQSVLGISISIGKPFRELEEINISMETAKNGLAHLHLYSLNEIIIPTDNEEKREWVNFPEVLRRDLIESVYTFNFEKLEQVSRRLKSFISVENQLTINEMNYTLHLILGDIMRIAFERGIPEKVINEGIKLMDEISPYKLRRSSIDVFLHYCNVIAVCIQQSSERNVASSIQKVRKYIDLHYREEDISLKKLAAMFHINHSYLSTSFKKYTNKNFNDYLNCTRIEHAKRMLEDKGVKVNQVAAAVGFNDVGYFGKTFKRYTGMMPSDFQKEPRDKDADKT